MGTLTLPVPAVRMQLLDSRSNAVTMLSMAMFIVLEGGEGSGKSTQARFLAEALQAQGAEVVLTFEPGGTPRGVAMRQMLLDDESPLDARAELLMMAADRAQHVNEVVRPALERGAHVVCDRFEPSSLAYQGIGRAIGVDAVAEVSAFARSGVEADITIVLDISDEIAVQRRPVASDRMEKAGIEFHQRVRRAYRDLAAARNWIVVDGDGTPAVVAARVWAVVHSRTEVGS